MGNLDRTDLPNGVVTDYEYDALNRLDVMTDYAPDGTPEDLSDNQKLAQYDYTVRADGKRTAATETFWLDEDNNPATAPTAHVNQIDWTYDDIGRLTDEVFNHFDDALDRTEHFVYDLTGNRKSFTIDQGNDASVDEAITYLYDANDRLIDELLDSDNDGQTDQTTSYGYDHTQQTAKTVTDHVTSQVSGLTTYAYDLQGRLAAVKTEGFAGGALSSRQRVTFDYDATGIRVGSASYSDTVLDADQDHWTLQSTTEFLVDHRNFTGYQQVIKETTYDDQGNVVETIEYTFGHDEIAQTVTDAQGNATTHVFGHDGRGSVRVLFDMAAAIAQVFAFDAYGQLLSIHNGAGQFVSANAADALTSMLYSGERFDTAIQQRYLRARYYDPAIGRFNRLDDFAGNMQDPQSLHKYLYVHGDPVQGVDPTGLLLGGVTVGAVVRGALIGMTVGAITGAIAGGIDGYLARGRWDDALDGAISGAIWGGIIGLVTGGLGAWLGPAFSSMSAVAKLRFLRGLFVFNLLSTGYSVVTAESLAQGLFRGGTGLLGGLSILRAMRMIKLGQVNTPSPRARYKAGAKALDVDGGHSHGKHGAHVTPEQHQTRLTIGVAPDGTPGPIPPASGSFATNKVHVDAYERALAKLWQNPLKTNGNFKKQVDVVIDLKGAGRSYKLDAAGNLISTKADKVKAIFKLNAEGNDYILWTMYPEV